MFQSPFASADIQQAQQWLPDLCQLTEAACAAIMPFYRQAFAVRHKGEAGPVTDADHASHRVFMEGLARLTPDIPVVSEELEVFPDISSARRFWLIDPLDGTKSFVRGEESFCTCAALVVEGRPLLGVIGWPVAGKLYGGVVGGVAFRQAFGQQREAVALKPARRPVEVLFSSRGISQRAQAWLESLGTPYRIRSLASAQKFCLLAEGEVDIYPRFILTMEWDTAAGQAIVEAAGGEVLDWEGKPLRYGKPGWENPGFIARKR